MSVSNSPLRSRENILARFHSTVVRTAKSAPVFALQASVDVKTEFIVEDVDTESLAAMTTKIADPVDWIRHLPETAAKVVNIPSVEEVEDHFESKKSYATVLLQALGDGQVRKLLFFRSRTTLWTCQMHLRHSVLVTWCR